MFEKSDFSFVKTIPRQLFSLKNLFSTKKGDMKKFGKKMIKFIIDFWYICRGLS